mgnify:CR=1 FL=1
MVWGEDGFLAALGSVDFAGGNVVHISSGVSALVLAICLGRRRGYEHTSYRIHNIPFVTLGASLLWFGWFGFNAGSALAADGLAAHAFMTSAIASASAMLVWMLIDYLKSKKNHTCRCFYRTGHRACSYHPRCRICSDLVFFPDRCTCQSDLLFYRGALKTEIKNR